VVLQLADALQFLHDRQITFQNFKLSNLLVRKSVNNMNQLHLMLVDFAARQDGTFFSKSQESFPYVAPERWYGLVSPGSDQYGLAVIAYELLTGRLPFQGSSEPIMKLLHTSMMPQPPSTYNPAISPSIDSILLRALSKKPQGRFSSVILFAKTFQNYAL
jgi:serine/threonine protein kinase